MTHKLSLGPLPSTKVVKHTITLNCALNAELDRYAALHSEIWGEAVDGPTLVPHIIEQFLRRDRNFKRWKQSGARMVRDADGAATDCDGLGS